MDHFLTGLACVESGGRFTAENARSGAYGKYQIMPRNWVAWAGRYLGNRWADPTPRNQEYVARQRISALFERHRSWRVTARWWLTGDGDPDERRWSAHSTRYVERVMGMARKAASRDTRRAVPARCFPAELGPPNVRTKPFEWVRVDVGQAFIRVGPGYENSHLAVVKRGIRLVVLRGGRDPRGNRWLKVGLRDGRKGWVAQWLTSPAR